MRVLPQKKRGILSLDGIRFYIGNDTPLGAELWHVEGHIYQFSLDIFMQVFSVEKLSMTQYGSETQLPK